MLISVVIPVYNAEKYIEECILSVVNQSYKSIQLICVDNNSNDTSTDVINKLMSEYDFIELYSEINKGANFARNTGLKYAKGKYIQFLDADDIITKDKLQSQASFMEQNNLDIVVSDRKVFDESLTIELDSYEFHNISISPLQTAVSEIIITGNPLYKTEFIKKKGGYLKELQSAQDWEFHIRLFLNTSKIGYLEGFFLNSRSLDNSLSNENYISVSDNVCSVIKMYKDELIENKIYKNIKSYRKIIFSYFISYINSNRNVLLKSEFLFWYKLRNGKKVFNIFNRFLISILGIEMYLKLKEFNK